MTATGNLLGTAVSGLLAYQRAMAATGHNVSNANTPGYSRQTSVLTAQSPLPSGGGFIGTGVTVETVTRAYDQFLTAQLRTTTSGQGQLSTSYALSKQIDNIVADPQAGLSPALQDFFAALQTVADDPNASSARQLLLSQATSLTNRFHYLADRFNNLASSVNTQISSTISQANALGSSIAKMNQQIYELEGAYAGQPPNDMLDKRDEAIRQLSELVAVRVVSQDNGMQNVFIGNGQGLVIGNQAAVLSATQNEFDPETLDVSYSFGGGTVANITHNITGGKLGGVIDFRDGLLKTTMDQLGRVALGLSDAFNAQHRLGLDQGNALGQDFFTDLGTQVAVDNRTNNVATNITLTGTVTDIGALKASDYRIDFSAGIYNVVRMSDNTVVSASASAAVDLTATEGFSIAAAMVTAPTNGDSFMLRFTAPAAKNFGVSITQSSQIALAAPLRSSATLTNTGNGAITQGAVSNTLNLPMGAPLTLTFSPNALGAGVPGFTVAGGVFGPLAYNPATEFAGKSFTLAAPGPAAGYGSYTFSISGTPSTNDTFIIGNNTNAASDNRNALKLVGFQTNPTLINGAAGPTVSILGAYTNLVADVGTRTRQADIDQQAQQALLNQAVESQSNIAGVNLDEEAANLVRFQQAYQAAAQMVSASQTMFATLLSVTRG